MIPIESGEVHLWIAHDEQITDSALLTRYRDLLEAHEAERQQLFHFPQHRHQYLVARALLRYVLSLYTESVAPRDLRFEKNAYGKPSLVNFPETALCFNLSHTDKMVVLSVAGRGEIGTDVEWPSRARATTQITAYFSPAEIEHLRRLPRERQDDRFFDIWTLKEAYIKARGKGLSIPLDQFSCTISAQGLVEIAFAPELDDRPEHWQFWQALPNTGHKIAVAHSQGLPRSASSLVIREVVPLRGFGELRLPSIRSMPHSAKIS